MQFWKVVLASIVLINSNSVGAAIVDVTFSVATYNRATASIGEGLISANPVPPGTYVQWDTDSDYSREQFEFSIRLDSNTLRSDGTVYPDGMYVNGAQYDNPQMFNTSSVAQDANSYVSSISTRRDDRFAFARDPAPEGEISNERLYMYSGSLGSVDTRIGDDRYNQSYKNLAYVGINWYDILRDQQDSITSHDDFVALLEGLMADNSGFQFWHQSTNTSGTQENFYTDGSSRFIYDFVEGVRYQGAATIIGVNPVPVPAAVWLFGSGLIGLAGFARRKNA